MAPIVILGAGVIGCSTAYYLTESQSVDPMSVHLIEASPELFASASGKAGGFLASDWFGPSTASLGALSFRLHEKLALENDGKAKWGYSPSTGASFTESDNKIVGKGGDDWLKEGNSRADVAAEHEFHEGSGPAWLTRRKGDNLDVIAQDETVAQVDPLRLSRFLLGECVARGVQLHQPAKAVGLTQDSQGQLIGVKLQQQTGTESEVPCTRLLLSAGAWTPRVFQTLFPSSKQRIPISHLAGHSIVVRSPRWTTKHEAKGCHAVFPTMRNGFSPEIFSRIGNEIYVAGLNDPSLPLPEVATDAKISRKDIDELKEISQRLLCLPDDKEDLEVIREGLCFRPVTPRGQPILCRIPDSKLGGIKTRGKGEGGVFVAAGHGPWGISHSLGTGKVMAEMIEGKPTSANIKALGMQ